MNYDGAAKGNLGAAGFSGAFKDAVGEIMWVYARNLGAATNNVAELQDLEHDLAIAKE